MKNQVSRRPVRLVAYFALSRPSYMAVRTVGPVHVHVLPLSGHSGIAVASRLTLVCEGAWSPSLIGV